MPIIDAIDDAAFLVRLDPRVRDRVAEALRVAREMMPPESPIFHSEFFEGVPHWALDADGDPFQCGHVHWAAWLAAIEYGGDRGHNPRRIGFVRISKRCAISTVFLVMGGFKYAGGETKAIPQWESLTMGGVLDMTIRYGDQASARTGHALLVTLARHAQRLAPRRLKITAARMHRDARVRPRHVRRVRRFRVQMEHVFAAMVQTANEPRH